MPRSTAIIREILVYWLILKWIEQDLPAITKSRMGDLWISGIFDSLHRSLLQQIRLKKQKLRKNGAYVMEQHIFRHGILIVYKEQNQLQQVQYPFEPLLAEAKASFLQGVQMHVQIESCESN